MDIDEPANLQLGLSYCHPLNQFMTLRSQWLTQAQVSGITKSVHKHPIQNLWTTWQASHLEHSIMNWLCPVTPSLV